MPEGEGDIEGDSPKVTVLDDRVSRTQNLLSNTPDYCYKKIVVDKHANLPPNTPLFLFMVSFSVRPLPEAYHSEPLE